MLARGSMRMSLAEHADRLLLLLALVVSVCQLCLFVAYCSVLYTAPTESRSSFIWPSRSFCSRDEHRDRHPFCVVHLHSSSFASTVSIAHAPHSIELAACVYPEWCVCDTVDSDIARLNQIWACPLVHGQPYIHLQRCSLSRVKHGLPE